MFLVMCIFIVDVKNKEIFMKNILKYIIENRVWDNVNNLYVGIFEYIINII